MAQVPASSHGGGFTPVTIVLQLNGNLDLKGVSGHVIKWDSAYDDTYFDNALASAPAGLGLTVPLTGLSETITTTTAGVWLVNFVASFPSDATYQGSLVVSPFVFSQGVKPGVLSQPINHALALEINAPSGKSFSFAIDTGVDATAGTYVSGFPSAQITRVA